MAIHLLSQLHIAIELLAVQVNYLEYMIFKQRNKLRSKLNASMLAYASLACSGSRVMGISPSWGAGSDWGVGYGLALGVGVLGAAG